MADFIGIGAQKSATTWLFHQLSCHPKVHFPGGKECHFWDSLSSPDPQAWKALFSPFELPQGDVAGEITPSYALLQHPVISLIRDSCPEIRIFYSLRNPMERAWSAACMGLEQCQMQLSEASDQWFSDHVHSAASRQRGDYLGCLQRWLACFPAEQLLVLFFDEIKADPEAVLRRLAVHLGVDPDLFPAASLSALQRPVVPLVASSSRDRSAHLRQHLLERPALLKTLHALYDEPIMELGHFLGVSLEHWIRFDHQPSPQPSIDQEVQVVSTGGSGVARVQQLLSREAPASACVDTDD